METAGIILSGGKSQRMGKDKALLEIAGTNLLEIAYDKLVGLCDDVFISSNIPLHGNSRNLIKDEFEDAGPLGGIISAMRKAKARQYLVLAVDMPAVPRSFLQQLLKAANGSMDAVVPQYTYPEPLCALYKKSCLPVFENLLCQNIKTVYKAYEQFDVFYYPVKNPKGIFRNINMPEDYAEIKSLYAPKS